MSFKPAGWVGALSLAAANVCAQEAPPSRPPLTLSALDPVVVSATKLDEPQGQATVLIDVIDRQEIENSGLSNVTELLDRRPGLSITRQYGRLGIDAAVDVGYLGGSSHHRTLVLVDGVRLNDIDDSTVGFGSIPLSSIERIEIRRAGGGVLFGDRALGGVINIITKPAMENKAEANAGLGSFGLKTAGVSLARALDAASLHLDVHRATLDGYRRDSWQAQTGLLARWRMPTPAGEFGVVVRTSDENLRLPQSIPVATFRTDPRNPGSYRTDSQRESRTGILSFDSMISGQTKIDLRLVEDVLDRKSIDPYARTNYETSRHSFQADVSRRSASWLALMGLEWTDATSDSNRTNRSRIQQKSEAIYAGLEHSAGVSKVMFGARTQSMKNKFSPSLAGASQDSEDRLTSWSLASRTEFVGGVFRAGVQSSFAFPNADQLYTFDSASPYAPKNIYPGVGPMTSREIQFGWAKATGKHVYDFSVRRILVKDEIGYRSGCDGLDDCNDNLYDTERTVATARYQQALDSATMLEGSVDIIRAVIDSGSNQGRQIPMTPRRAGKIGIQHNAFGGRASVWANYRDAIYQNADDAHSYSPIPGRTVFDLGWRKEVGSMRIQAWIRNLTDRRYYDFAQYDSVATADGRSFEVAFRYGF